MAALFIEQASRRRVSKMGDMSRMNFFIGLILGAIGGWLGDMFFGRSTLENQMSALRAERIVVQWQLKDAERVVGAQSAEIADLKSALSA